MSLPVPRSTTFLAAVLLGLVTLAPAPAAASAPAALRTDGGGVVDGSLRIQVLTPTLLRLEYAADGEFEDRPTFNAVARTVRPPAFTARRSGGELEVRTSAVTFRYRAGSGPVGPANASLELTVGRSRVRVHPQFGSPARPDALGGWYRGLDYYPGQAGPPDQVRLHPGMLNRGGWYLLDDSATALRTADGWVAPRPGRTGAYQDGYLFGYGHDYRRGLADLRLLTGPSPLLPKWAFGTWFSKYHPYSAADYRDELLPAFRANRVPLDALMVDTDWKAPNQWAGWNWNPGLFPQPQAFLDWAARERLQVLLNVHAAISADDPRFAAAQAIAKGKLAPAAASFAPTPHRFDWTDRDQAAAWAWLHRPFEEQGVGPWWLDYCCDDSLAAVPGVTPDAWVNELYRRGTDARGSRGFALSRIGASYPDYTRVGGSGPWAEHRNTVHFTGDTRADWESLAAAAAMTPAEGSIGQAYVSHDIGSFAGKHLPPDLYLRWVQFGAFQPVLRLHSDHGDRLPWEYAAPAGPAAAQWLRLRESLVPYLYATARQAHDTGVPMARALYLDWPEHEAAYQHPTQYLLGDSLLVAPVTTAGLSTTTRVWFPPGTWTDFFTGATFRGPAEHTVGATPDRMPVYVRGGGIVPQAPPAPNVASQPADALRLTVAPHGSGTTSLYDDAGDGPGYRRGQFARTPVRYHEGASAVLAIGPTAGRYPGQPASRRYTVAFANVTRPHAVTVDGHRAAYRYDAGRHRLTVAVPPTARTDRVVVTHDGRPVRVAPPPAVALDFTAPDGLAAGSTSRLVAVARNDGPGEIRDLGVEVAAPAGWVVEPRTPTGTARLAPGGTFTVTFGVTPAGPAPRTANVVANLRYRTPDGARSSVPAALTVPLRPVAVTFRTAAPPGTPPDATLYVPGSIDQLGPWDPGKVAMTPRGGGLWEATVTVLDGTDLQYKYTRGTWETVEEWGTITGTNNRSVTVDGGITQTMLVDDTSTAWGDPAVPDSRKAVQYWRDPLVVTTTPAAGTTGPAPTAVTVAFHRDVAPTGADYSGSVTVQSGAIAVAGSTAEPAPGVLAWTPAAPLAPGAYQVTVDAVASAIGPASIPIRRPYVFEFTVG